MSALKDALARPLSRQGVYSQSLLAELEEAVYGLYGGHYVTFNVRGWFIEHSLECRESGEMAKGCAYQKGIEKIAHEFHRDNWGCYEIVEIDSGGSPVLRTDRRGDR